MRWEREGGGELSGCNTTGTSQHSLPAPCCCWELPLEGIKCELHVTPSKAQHSMARHSTAYYNTMMYVTHSLKGTGSTAQHSTTQGDTQLKKELAAQPSTAQHITTRRCMYHTAQKGTGSIAQHGTAQHRMAHHTRAEQVGLRVFSSPRSELHRQ